MDKAYFGGCPTEVADAITSILRESILLIRSAANGNDADWCAVESNHIHNLPSLLRCYKRSRLERYLAWAQTVYTSDFQKRFDRLPTMFTPDWERLTTYLTHTETSEDSITASVNGTFLHKSASRAA